ncbi:MAG: hypothetical protein ACLGIC_05120 [Acidimicrobiia bacterium]
MQKRFLAILAMVATVFAFGVGSALAQQPDDPGSRGGSAGCENGNPPDCEDGKPGYGEGGDGSDDDETGGDEGSPLDALCEALGEVVPEVEEPCLELVDALTGGEAPTPPGGGDGFDCTQLAPLGEDFVAGCESLKKGEAPTPPEGLPVPPEDLPIPPGDGGGPTCADLDQLKGAGLPGEVVDAVKGGCETLVPPAA